MKVEDPNEFLSTVQIGISLIGVLTGAFGGVTLSEPLSRLISFLPYNDLISIIIVVVVTTYLTLVIGEIVPKVIALNDPERVSLKVAKSMVILSKVSKPVSFVLAKSSSFLLWLLRIENKNNDITSVLTNIFSIYKNSKKNPNYQIIINLKIKTVLLKKKLN